MGKQATKVVSTFKTMGVPVHYKQVPVSDTKKKPIGSVVATYPAEGQALSDGDKDDGIYIGVATKSDGGAISIDIVYRDVDTVKSELESQGHDVTLRAAPRPRRSLSAKCPVPTRCPDPR